MLAKVQKSRRYAVNILTENMRQHALHFGGRPNEALTDLFREHHGMPILRNAAAVIVADLVQEVDAGDRVILLGRVRHLERNPTAAPLLFHAGRFGSLSSVPVD